MLCVGGWALAGARKAAGHTQEDVAAALHIDRSTVIRWEAGDHAPLPYLRPKLARLLGLSQEQLRKLIEDDSNVGPDADGASADVEVAFDWLDQHAGWPLGMSRRKVMFRLGALDERALHDQRGRRRKAGRSEVAQVLSDYYGNGYAQDFFGTYRARYDGREVATSIVTRSQWLNLACALTPAHDRLMLAKSSPSYRLEVDDFAAKHAVRRLIEAVALDVRITNAPIYRLLELDVQGAIGGAVGIASFVEYALTMDLLEGELLDAIVRDVASRPGSLALRDRYLPDLGSVLNMASRLCGGGVLALCAIARPADTYRGAADYVLLVQERSEHVLNAARQLAVIPKSFHKPLVDYRADAQIGATLRREMEKELFGRSDIDSTISRNIVAAPMHPS